MGRGGDGRGEVRGKYRDLVHHNNMTDDEEETEDGVICAITQTSTDETGEHVRLPDGHVG